MFFETARCRINAVESDWDSKISPKNWVLKKIDGFLDTKYWNLSKPLKVKCRKFAVESDWDSKISQNVQCLGFFKRTKRFSRKKWFFLKVANGRKVGVEYNWNSNFSRNVVNLVIFKE